MMPPETMRAFALVKTLALLDDVVFAMRTAQRLPDVETVHKMRVAIRRLEQALRLFREYLRKRGVKKIKAELRLIMGAAGELRNCDIAVDLVRDTGGKSEALVADISERRLEFNQKLADVLMRYAKPDLALQWRVRLGVEHV